MGTVTVTSLAAAATSSAAPTCAASNDYDGRMGLRISAIFVILVGSTFGACFPVFAARNRQVLVPEWVFFIAKYFGSGVIIATAFIHLLAPANDALTDECLTGTITEYDWVEGIVLMTIFVLFFIELMAMRFATFDQEKTPHRHEELAVEQRGKAQSDKYTDNPAGGDSAALNTIATRSRSNSHAPGEDHLSHSRRHVDHEAEASKVPNQGAETSGHEVQKPTEGYDVGGKTIHDVEDFSAQLVAISILEFGVIFHSIFIGLTLAVTGTEFNTLYVVLVFHQTFEGLGLGSRLAATPWPVRHRWAPYWMAALYGIATPVAIAVGLGVRNTYTPGSATSLIVNGVFDSISAGILIYTGLVELLAHEFMFSAVMRRASLKVVLAAVGVMALGAALMALLGKWA